MSTAFICTRWNKGDIQAARDALEEIRLTAMGNDYVNEHDLQRLYGVVDEALDELERLREKAP
jgi:hypothetical protein